MILWVWKRNDGSGILDEEFRDGDVFMTKPDSFEPSIGSQEKKSWLIVRIPDPVNAERVAEDLVREEYATGQGGEPVIRRARIYTVAWRTKFTSEELATLEAGAATLPDGPSVTAGVVHGRFTIGDVTRK